MTCPTPGCGATYRVPAEQIGRSGRCKRCGAVITLTLTAEPGPGVTTERGGEPSSSGQSGLAETEDSEALEQPLSERFGRFQILRRLGDGGMGSVYLAFDTLMNRKVALKIPRLG